MAKILNVFYGADNLPYKDKERTVHFPIVGNAFQGASDTTEIRFYFDRIGEPNTSWVAVSKLPNGKIGSKVLQVEEDTTLEEEYALLKLSSFYTQYKGDLFISLQGYNGEVQVEYDESSELYTIKGTPTIQATGSIKLAINYATQFVGSGEESNADLQSMLSLLGTKLNIGSGIVVLTDLANTDLSSYSNGQLIYDKTTDAYYIKTNSSPYYQLADTNGLLGNKGALARYEVNGTSEVRQLYTIIGDRLVCLKTNNHDYLVQMSSNSVILVYDVIAGYIYFYASANESAITLNQVISDTYKQIIATEGYVNSQDALLQAAIDNLRNYVDDQDDAIKNYVDTQDNSLKTYVDSQDAKKLDKVTTTSPTALRLYAVSGSGVQQMLNVGENALDIPQRKFNKQINVPLIPSSPDDATSKSYVDSKFSALGSALIYMGSKTVAQLNALTNIKTGDFYNVSSNGTLTQGNVKVNEGDNVAWDGSKWDKLSSDIDLSAYYNKTETDALLDEKQDLLVSGSNIKTINNQSILGSGNITIQGTGGDYLEVISINVPSTLADFYTAYNSKPKIILTNIGYCSISVDTDGQDYFFEIECLYNSKRWALSWLAGDSGISGSTIINSIVTGTTYRKDYLTEENGLTKVEAFTILSQKFDFTVPTSAWTSISSGVFNAQATITLTNTYLDDDTNVEAFFENVVDSAGVVLASATQSGSDLVLVFYANESKTNAIGGFIKYVY